MSEGYQKLWGWFGLTRASFIVLPRVLAHEMPDEWQSKMADLLDEFQDAFHNLETEEYCFQVRSEKNGKLVKMPEWLKNYRRPDSVRIKEVKKK